MNKIQIEDIKKVIKNHNYQPTEFELNRQELNRIDQDALEELQGSVVVKRKTTGKERTYTLGKNAEWFENFKKDLKQGIFE